MGPRGAEPIREIFLGRGIGRASLRLSAAARQIAPGTPFGRKDDMERSWYLVCSDKPQVTHAGRGYDGVRCGCAAAHYFYALSLTDDELKAYPKWSLGPRCGRREYRDFYVSNSCAVPGTSLALRRDDGPRRLSGTVAEWLLDGGRAPAPPRLVPLSAECKGVLAAEISRLASCTRNQIRMAGAYAAMMHCLLWSWTADAYDAYDEELVRDGFKYDFGQLRHTHEAHAQFVKHRNTSRLVHEHAVPRKVLVRHLLSHELEEPLVAALLEGYCFGVIVTAAQDRDALGGPLRSEMPPGWRFGDSQGVLARYDGKLIVHQPGQCTICTGETET